MPVFLHIVRAVCALKHTQTHMKDNRNMRHSLTDILFYRRSSKKKFKQKQTNEQPTNNRNRRKRHDASDLIKYIVCIRANDDFLRFTCMLKPDGWLSEWLDD